MCMFVYVWVCICAPPPTKHPQKSEEGFLSPGTGVRDGCQLSCGCRECSPSFQQVQQVLLSVELHPQAPNGILMDTHKTLCAAIKKVI